MRKSNAVLTAYFVLVLLVGGVLGALAFRLYSLNTVSAKSGRRSPEEYRKRASQCYAQGLDNLFFWDTNARYDFSPSWSALRRLGHKEELEAWVRAGSPALPRPATKLKKLGDWDLTYATPG